MRRLYKHRINDGGLFPSEQLIEHCDYVVAVGLDADGLPSIWYVHDDDEDAKNFFTTYTGQGIPQFNVGGDLFDCTHLGFVVVGPIVLHVWMG